MSSKTTEWRRRKFGTPADGRGRHSNEDRAERLAFVGAVAAQLIASGSATHYGLKTCGQRVPTKREQELKSGLSLAMTAGNAKETKRLLAEVAKESLKAVCGDSRVAWVRPADDVWREIQSAPFNADLLALVVAEGMVNLGQLRYRVRHASQRGTGHSDKVPRRNRAFSCEPFKSDAMDDDGEAIEQDDTARPLAGDYAPSKTPWRVIDGMTKQTASFWKRQRKSEFQKAGRWFVGFLTRHGVGIPVENSASGMLRDDLADVMTGRVLKIPRTAARATAIFPT